ncbi:MAG: acyl-CoA thioesterase [Bacteroidota bacterium]
MQNSTSLPLPADPKSLPALLHSQRKVRFQDCDPFGHLNNSAYLDYIVNAREDHVAEFYELDIYAWSQSRGSGWVFGKHEIVYRKPALFNEIITLTSRLIGFGEKFLRIEASILDQKRTHLKALMWSDLVYIDMKTTRPTPHQEELMNLFAGVVRPIGENRIEQRAKTIENELLTVTA